MMHILSPRFGATLAVRADSIQDNPQAAATGAKLFAAMDKTQFSQQVKALQDARDPMAITLELLGDGATAKLVSKNCNEMLFNDTQGDADFSGFLTKVITKAQSLVSGINAKLEGQERLSRETRRLVSQLKSDVEAGDFQFQKRLDGLQKHEVPYHCQSSVGAEVVIGGQLYNLDKTVSNGNAVTLTVSSADGKTRIVHTANSRSLNSLRVTLPGQPGVDLVEQFRNQQMDGDTVLKLGKLCDELLDTLNSKRIFS